MAFEHFSGPVRIEWWPKTASEAFVKGDLVQPDESGAVTKADSTSGNHVGIIQKTVASGDDDYASNTEVPVLVPTDENLWLVDVDTGTALTAAMVGGLYDLTDANSLNVGAQSKKVVTIKRFISATKAVVKVNSMISYSNVDET